MGIGASSPKKNFKAGSERQLDDSLVIRLLDKDDYSKGMLQNIIWCKGTSVFMPVLVQGI